MVLLPSSFLIYNGWMVECQSVSYYKKLTHESAMESNVTFSVGSYGALPCIYLIWFFFLPPSSYMDPTVPCRVLVCITTA